ncbi:ATPase, T2SS/T4P/T4SS family [Caulobacter segnis]
MWPPRRPCLAKARSCGILDSSHRASSTSAPWGSADYLKGCLTQAARSPHGIFLVTGPTGSGKTTTLYGLLQTFAKSDRKVLSVEDPVEYRFEHVTQTQVAPGLGLTFAAALRSRFCARTLTSSWWAKSAIPRPPLSRSRPQ